MRHHSVPRSLAALLLAGSTAACGVHAGDAGARPAAAAPPAAASQDRETVTLADGSTAAARGTADIASEATVRIEGGDWYFAPTVLEGAAGQRLTVEVVNPEASASLHNFLVAEQGIDRDVAPGETIEVDVVLPPSGALVFVCKFHLPLDMRGQFIVGGGPQ